MVKLCSDAPGVDFCCFLSQYEAKTRLEGMSGSTSISSADLFGDGSDHKGKMCVFVREMKKSFVQQL